MICSVCKEVMKYDPKGIGGLSAVGVEGVVSLVQKITHFRVIR